jgi:glycosyltransferase involved in cell wall biosynthesis
MFVISRIFRLFKLTFNNCLIFFFDKNKKVIIVPEFSEQTGTHTYFLNLLTYFNEKYEQIIIVAHESKKETIIKLSSQFLFEAYYYQDEIDHWQYYGDFKKRKVFYVIDRLLPSVEYLQKIILKTKASTVWISPQIPGHFLFASVIPVRIYYVIHAILWAPLDHANEQFVKWNFFLKKIKFLTVSKASKNKITSLWGAHLECKIEVVPNFYEKPKAYGKMRTEQPLQQSFNILTIGTLDKNKRPDLFLELAKKYAQKNSNKFYFTWVGDGPLFTKYRSLASNFSNISFTGNVDDVSIYYERSHIYLQLSDEESQGISILGAMAYSLPCIVTDSGGPSETVVNGKTGFIVPVNSLEDIFEKLKLLNENSQFAREMGLQANQRWEMNYRVEEWMKLMDNVMKK